MFTFPLISGKADVNILNQQKETPLFIASRDGLDEMVLILIKAGANMDFQCEEAGNQTPLIIATANEQNKVVKLLLKVRMTGVTLNI